MSTTITITCDHTDPDGQRCGARTPITADQMARHREMLAKASPKLSGRQQSILSYVNRYQREEGQSPSLAEIARGVGLRSPSSVVYQLEKLEEYGVLRRSGNRTRAIALRRIADPLTLARAVATHHGWAHNDRTGDQCPRHTGRASAALVLV